MGRYSSVDFIAGWKSVFINKLSHNEMNSITSTIVKPLHDIQFSKSWVDMINFKQQNNNADADADAYTYMLIRNAISSSCGAVGCAAMLSYTQDNLDSGELIGNVIFYIVANIIEVFFK